MFFKANEMEKYSKVTLACHGEKMMGIYCDFPKGYKWEEHAHPQDQMCFVLSGSIEYVIDGESCVMNAGDTCYLHSNARHTAVALEDTKVLDIFTPLRMDMLAWFDKSIVADPFVDPDTGKYLGK